MMSDHALAFCGKGVFVTVVAHSSSTILFMVYGTPACQRNS